MLGAAFRYKFTFEGEPHVYTWQQWQTHDKYGNRLNEQTVDTDAYDYDQNIQAEQAPTPKALPGPSTAPRTRNGPY